METGQLPIVDALPVSPELLPWDLGAGETAVLAYTLANPGWTAVLDDGAARKCARSFAITVKGTLAIVVLAKKKGLIPSASDVLRRLRDNGFYLNDALIRDVLRQTVSEILLSKLEIYLTKPYG